MYELQGHGRDCAGRDVFDPPVSECFNETPNSFILIVSWEIVNTFDCTSVTLNSAS